MKNNYRSSVDYSPERDVEKNLDVDGDGEELNENSSRYHNRPVITESPSRSNMNLNTNFQPNNSSNLMNKHQQQMHQQQQQQSRYYDPRGEPPIYVPPFLVAANARQGARHHSHPKHNAPQDYLPWSIANIFICVIIALPALFFSVQTRDMKRAGNIKKAKVNSKRSLVLNIIASVTGLVIILTAVLLRFALYQLFVENDIKYQNVPLIAGG